MEILKSTFLLIKYSVQTILIEWINLLRIRSLNVKFSKYQKQSSGGVLPEGVLKIFVRFIKNIKNIRDAIFNLKFHTKRSQTLLKIDSGICAFLRISQKF